MLVFLKKKISILKSFLLFSKLSSESRKIVFYAEDAQSQNYLIDLVRNLLIYCNEEVCYLTSDPKDSMFLESKKFTNLNVFFIGSGFARTWMFMNLNADLMIMTMPDIEKYHIKRSRIYKVHYLYIFHALVSTHSNYRKGAFDSYDTIFCTGEQQILEIRKTENHYGLKRKNLFRDGYRPIEFLIEENRSFKKVQSDILKILIAPSWGENTILEHCISELVDNIAEKKVEIYLRPHPMTIRNSYDALQDLKLKYREKKNFYIQENPINRNILFESDILITDWSGIGMEYGMGLEKPVLYIDMPKKNFNPEFNEINLMPIEVSVRSEIGTVIKIKDLHNINEIISDSIKSYDKNKIEKVRGKYVFIKKKASIKAAQKVARIANANRARNKQI